EGLDAAFAGVAAWHAQVVRTLRPLRQRLKFGFEPVDPELVKRFRARIQKTEIDAEHIEQLALAASAAAAAPPRSQTGPTIGAGAGAAMAADPLAAYSARLEVKPGAEDMAALRVVLGTAFALPGDAVQGHLDRAFA